MNDFATENMVKALEERLWNELKEIKPGNLEELNKKNNALQRLNELKELLRKCDEMYDEIANMLDGNIKQVEIEITQGALNQGYLMLTQPINQCLCPTNGEITIKTPFESFESEIDYAHKRLRQRGAIRKFYEQCNIVEGDMIIWKEVEKNKIYNIEPVRQI